MRRFLVATVLVIMVSTVLPARLFHSEGDLNLASEIDSEDETIDDNKDSEEKELDKALHEILYQDEDLMARAESVSEAATWQCRAALPMDVTSVIGYTNYRYPCVAFCKYRKTEGGSLYDGTYVSMNTTVGCGGESDEYVCADKKCVLPSTIKGDYDVCNRLIAQPVGTSAAFIVHACQFMCTDTGAFGNGTEFKYINRPDGSSCLDENQDGRCLRGRCVIS